MFIDIMSSSHRYEPPKDPACAAAKEGAGAEAQAGVAVLHRWVIVAELIYSLANAAPGAARRRGSVMAAAVAAAEADHV